MIPSPWAGVLLALGTFRLWRIVGWDDFPPILRVRDWLTRARLTTRGTMNARMGQTGEPTTVVVEYGRPLLAHFLGCSYCAGFWVSVGVYLAWLWQPTWVMYGMAPLALSAAVGLIGKRLDP